MTDVLVIGAGHNGLVAACYLARAGHDVQVVEANDWIGGCTTTAALIEGAPDHLVNACAGDVITLRAGTVVRDLGLERHGYHEVDVDPSYVALGPDGASLAFWRDPVKTAAEIRRFSERDARTYLELVRKLDRALDAMLPLMATNPTRPHLRAVMKALWAAARHPRCVAKLPALATGSAAQVIDEHFEHPVVKAGIGMLANLGSPVTGEGTGAALMVLALIARVGMARPVGGLQALPDALARCLAEHGGRIRTSARVDEVIVRGGRATGVRLADGEELHARAVLAATAPTVALNELLPDGSLPRAPAARAAAIPISNAGCAHFRVDVALRGRLELPRHAAWRGDGLDLRIPSASVGTFDELVTACGTGPAGHWPERPPFVAIVATSTDEESAPPGQDCLYLWMGWAPHDPPEGWDALADRAAQSLVARAAEHFENLEELEIARRIEPWPEIAARTGVPRGNVYHVDMGLMRQGPLRPALGFGGYKTPLPGFFITGAGTHPGPSVSGIPGQQAARVVRRRLGAPAPHTAVAEPAPETALV